MEELENDKMIYWILFFGGIIILAVVGHYYVFSYADSKEKQREEEKEVEAVELDNYIGVWQFFGDSDLPLQEVLINVVDGSTITFDYYVKDEAYFESQTASLEDDTATFSMSDRDESGIVSGKMTFRHNKVYFVILSSDIDGVVAGTYVFSDVSDESLLD